MNNNQYVREKSWCKHTAGLRIEQQLLIFPSHINKSLYTVYSYTKESQYIYYLQ